MRTGSVVAPANGATMALGEGGVGAKPKSASPLPPPCFRSKKAARMLGTDADIERDGVEGVGREAEGGGEFEDLGVDQAGVRGAERGEGECVWLGLNLLHLRVVAAEQ